MSASDGSQQEWTDMQRRHIRGTRGGNGGGRILDPDPLGAAAWGPNEELRGPRGGLQGRRGGHTDCSTNGRITGIVTPTQPP